MCRTWMDLEGITPSEISQTEKHKYCMIKIQPTSDYNKKKKAESYYIDNKLVGTSGEKEGRGSI